MKFRKIFLMEFGCQVRQVSTWLYFAIVFAVAFLTIFSNYSDDARGGYFLLNAPVVIAEVTVISCLFWLLVAPSIAGDAIARDVQTRMFSLTYSAPTSKAEYFGGRLLAAFSLNLLILLAIPLGIVLALYLTGMEAAILGPFRPAAYLSAWFLLVLPNAFFGTAIQFSMAAFKRSAMAAYLGGAILFAATLSGKQVFKELGYRSLGSLGDPLFLTPVMNFMSSWSPIERNARMVQPDGSFLANRALWLVVSLGMLAFAYIRFRFTIPAVGGEARTKPSQQVSSTTPGGITWGKAESLPQAQGVFGFATHLQQLKLMTRAAFLEQAKSRSGLLLLGCLALVVGFALPGNLKAKGVPLLPTTDQVLHVITAPITSPGKFWIIIFLLTIFYAGEMIWRERESGLSELSNAAPVPEWVLMLSKYLALCFLLIIWLVLLLVTGIAAQLAIGGADVELGLYIRALFGFQLMECLLFALFALVVHVAVNQKYIGHLVALMAVAGLMFAPMLGLQYKLLIFSSSPGWTYTTLGGFGSTVGPWLWFKAYWAAWALLFGVTARLLWVRSRDVSVMARLRLAVRRFTRTTALTMTIAIASVLTLGSFIFYNTNVRNRYSTASEVAAERAGYEQKYSRYRNVPQPQLTNVNLQVDLYPEEGELAINGMFLLVNKQSTPIHSLQLASPQEGEMTGLAFSSPVKQLFANHELGFSSYALKKPLKPGDTLRLSFKVHYSALGFTNDGADSVITSNFSSIRNYDWLPVIGYQQYRELDEPWLRKKYKLSPQPVHASLYDTKARNYAPFAEQISLDAVIGTTANQTVIAPGSLQKTWKKGNRRYFHYATEAPIRNEFAFYSANYAVHNGKWVSSQKTQNAVAIQVYHTPDRTENLERMTKSAKASLDYYTKQFGPYPHRQLRLVAVPGYGGGNHAAPINITSGEGFFLLNPKQDDRGFDLVTAVTAHEVAHQWWGQQLKSADVEGAGLLSESLAWYSAMGVLEDKYGLKHLQKLLSFLREEYENPRSRASLPLLQVTNPYAYYRKGPFALYALSRYVGKNKVDAALGKLLVKNPLGTMPMPTSLDLYRELEAVTPDSLQYLLRDLFEENIFWDLKAKQATVKQTKPGTWQVVFNLQARKQSVNEIGVEKNIPLADWIEIGVFAPAENGEERGKTLYLEKHLVTANQQSITLTLPVQPYQVGIDPNYLLVDWDTKDNLIEVKEIKN